MLSSLKTNGAVELSISINELLSNYPLPTVLLTKELDVAAVNRPAVDLFRIAGGRLQGMFFPQCFAEIYRVELLNRLHASKNEVQRMRIPLRLHNDTVKMVELHISWMENLEEASCLLVSVVDVSMEYEAEGELKKYRTYIEHSSEGIFCQEFIHPIPINQSVEEIIAAVKNNCRITECNPAMARMYSFRDAEEMKGLYLEQLFDFSEHASQEYFKNFIGNGFRIINAESNEKDRFGQEKYFLNNAIGIVEEGKLKRIWGTQQDITEIKKTEQQLKVLANLVEQTSDILTAADINYYPVTWNAAAEKIYGVTAEQALGKDLRQYISIDYGHYSKEDVRRMLEEKGEWRGEASFIRPTDKKLVYLWMTFKSMVDEKGKPLGFLVSASDMTERKENECRLRESENRFRAMADSSPVMIWMSDENSNITYLNNKWIWFTGKNIMKGNSEDWAKLVHPDDLQQVKAIYDKGFQNRTEVAIEYRVKNAKGAYQWVYDVSVPRFLEDGTFVGYIGSVVNIQDQKEKEQQLLHQATILENVSDVLVATDLGFRVTSMNQTAQHYYEISEEKAIGKKLSEIKQFHFFDTDLQGVVKELLENDGWSGEASFELGNGETKYFHYSLKGIYDEQGKKIGYISMGRDLTEKKLAEEKLKKSEQFYRTLIADALDGILLLNPEGKITFCSPSVKNVLGYEVEDVLEQNAFEYVHPEDLLWASQSFQKEVNENPEVKYIVIRLRKKSGEWTWCMVRGLNMLKNPFVNSIVLYFHDDTLRKETTEALKESEKKFRSLIRDLQVGVFLADSQGIIEMCNKSLTTMLSVPEELVIGRSVYGILAFDMVDEQGKMIPLEERPLTKAIATQSTVKDMVVGILHPVTQQRHWIMVNADPIHDENNCMKHVVCSVMDLTERKKLEQALLNDQISRQRDLTQATLDGQEAERKEIGKELHDNFGQQLTTIKLFLDMAKSTAVNEQTQEMINMALKGIGDVINEVRAMSRALVPSTLQDLGLVESIHELVDAIRRTQVISIELNLDGFRERLVQENQKLAIFRIVQEQLNNIVKHAHASLVSISLHADAREIRLEIRDNGLGFDKNKIRKGLGFINMRNRAELLGGSTEIISSAGKGCVLKVKLPFSFERNQQF